MLRPSQHSNEFAVAFWTMIDHLGPDNHSVELAIGMDHITEPKMVFIDKLGGEVLCRVDMTVQNRKDSIGRGRLDSGAYLNPCIEKMCDRDAGLTISISKLGVQPSKESTIWLNPSILTDDNWKAPFKSVSHNDNDVEVQEGDELGWLDGAPTITLHETAHTVLFEFNEWEREESQYLS